MCFLQVSVFINFYLPVSAGSLLWEKLEISNSSEDPHTLNNSLISWRWEQPVSHWERTFFRLTHTWFHLGKGRVEMIQQFLCFTTFMKLYLKCPAISLGPETVSKEAARILYEGQTDLRLHQNNVSQTANKFSWVKKKMELCTLWDVIV